MDSTQLLSLSASQIGVIAPGSVVGGSPDRLEELTSLQLAALTQTQLGSLVRAAGGLTSPELSALNETQAQRLNAIEIAELATMQIDGLGVTAIATRTKTQ